MNLPLGRTAAELRLPEGLETGYALRGRVGGPVSGRRAPKRGVGEDGPHHSKGAPVGAQLENLALTRRSQARRPGRPTDALDSPDRASRIDTSINGSRTNANLLTVDGGFNMDSGSNNSQISNVGVDFIDQVSMKTSNFSARYGRNSGAAIDVVTKSGTNKFKGSALEYMWREKWDANDYFNNLKGVAKPSLTYDNFGGSLGGPIMKNRVFFFGGVEWKRIPPLHLARRSGTSRTARCEAGDFSSIRGT